MRFIKNRIIGVVCVAILACAEALCPVESCAQTPVAADSIAAPGKAPVPRHRRDRTRVELDDGQQPAAQGVRVVDLSGDTVQIAAMDSVAEILAAEVLTAQRDSIRKDSIIRATYGKERVFKPNPTRAVWLSALFPGLGQIYNRRYWKLPIIVGGYIGLAYATSWNNGMLKDYTKAYGDAMDSDPNTRSYMNFYPSTTREEDIDMAWLKRVLKSKKDYYRRNRDLCIISMVGVYLLCMIDAYVDASLANFDISPELSMKVKPAVIEPQLGKLPAVGLQCALSF
ncbi:MAG: DUF5683 domain-containing protein [Muribaculaceae bacterium]